MVSVAWLLTLSERRNNVREENVDDRCGCLQKRYVETRLISGLMLRLDSSRFTSPNIDLWNQVMIDQYDVAVKLSFIVFGLNRTWLRFVNTAMVLSKMT